MILDEILQNTDAGSFTKRQQVFFKYTCLVLIDLVVLNLFMEFWDLVHIDAFTTSMLTAILLQILLQATLAIEHRAANYFKQKPGKSALIMRGFTTWFIVFSSKFVILGAIDFFFGHSVDFDGPLNGMAAFFAVIIAIIIAEQIFFRIYRTLG